MGDPRHQKKKYQTPSHPWQKARIDEEKQLKKEFGLKNKKELWRLSSKLRKFTRQAKRLIALKTEQARLEENELMTKVRKLGIVRENSSLSDVLNISVKDMLERRLQTVIFRKNMAKSIIQARQFVSHGHISLNGRRLTVPSYLVSVIDESELSYSTTSKISEESHPTRVSKK